MMRRSPSTVCTTGLVRCRPDLAPVVVSSSRGQPSNVPADLAVGGPELVDQVLVEVVGVAHGCSRYPGVVTDSSDQQGLIETERAVVEGHQHHARRTAPCRGRAGCGRPPRRRVRADSRRRRWRWPGRRPTPALPPARPPPPGCGGSRRPGPRVRPGRPRATPVRRCAPPSGPGGGSPGWAWRRRARIRPVPGTRPSGPARRPGGWPRRPRRPRAATSWPRSRPRRRPRW